MFRDFSKYFSWEEIILLIFRTTNLNERLYRRLFENLCLHTGVKPYDFLKKWKIILIPLDQTEERFFNHIKTTSGQKINSGIPSGVTGINEIKLFLHDDTNIYKNMENIDRGMHEFCHARLYEKHGSIGGLHVKGVHNNSERFKFSFWYRSKIFWQKLHVNCIDIRRYL